MNREQMSYSNITGQGLTGKGVKVASLETFRPNDYFTAENPFNQPLLATHGTHVMDCVKQVAPDVELVSLPSGGRLSGGEFVSSELIERSIPWALSNGVNIITASLGGLTSPKLEETIRKAKDKGVIFLTSNGNDDVGSQGGYGQSGEWVNVGAVHLYKGKPMKAYYSTLEGATMTQFSGLWVRNPPTGNTTQNVIGTSFSTPWTAGMVALVLEHFKKVTGKYLKHDQMVEFIVDHCVPLSWEGTGAGLFILPDMQTVDCNKYLGVESVPKEVKMVIGSDTMVVDGVKKKLDIAPSITNGRTVVPIRAISEAFGFVVNYDTTTKTITIKR